MPDKSFLSKAGGALSNVSSVLGDRAREQHGSVGQAVVAGLGGALGGYKGGAGGALAGGLAAETLGRAVSGGEESAEESKKKNKKGEKQEIQPSRNPFTGFGETVKGVLSSVLGGGAANVAEQVTVGISQFPVTKTGNPFARRGGDQ